MVLGHRLLHFKVGLHGVLVKGLASKVLAVVYFHVFIPLDEAEPAELVLAVAAGHAIAPLVFLDVKMTVWTLLRVEPKPVKVG